jgi:GTP cyclohydrolase I
VTPDPSENDDTDNSEQGMLDTCDDLCCQQQLGHISAADVEPASSWLQLRAVGLVVDGRNRSMEAALQLLLSECGVNVASATIQAAIRRHVLALLAATSGCHQEQPSRPFSSSSSHLQQLEQQKMEQPHSAAAASVAGNCRISGGQRLHGQCISVSGNSSSSSRLLQLQPQPLGQHHEHPCNQYDIFEHHVVFISQCEHHMLPFHGTVHFAYLLPRSSSCSSGCPRAPASCCSSNNRTQQQPLSAAEALQLVSCYTKRLQVQERITAQVAEAVQRLLQPLGVMVVVSAVHMCMVARGVENHAGSTSTRAALGLFENDPQLRCQVLKQLRCQSAATRPGQEAAM